MPFGDEVLWTKETGASENWARDHLSDITSSVNQLGLRLRRALTNVRPCYYRYFQDQSGEAFKPIDHRPQCGMPLLPYTAGIFRQLVGEACGIVAAG